MKAAVFLFAFSALFVAALSDSIPLWAQRALSFQRNIAQNTTINYAQFPCAHNAFNNPTTLPPLLVQYENLPFLQNYLILQNQKYSLTQLMGFGIRNLQLEVHYVPELNGTFLCNGDEILNQICPLVEAIAGISCAEAIGFLDLGSATGCTNSSQTWISGLQEIYAFVNSSNDLFLIDITTDIDPGNITKLFDPIISIFSDIALTTDDLNNTWPTLAEVLSLGKNVIFSTPGTYPEAQGFNIDLQKGISFPNNVPNDFISVKCSVSNLTNASTSWSFFQEDSITLDFDLLGLQADFNGPEVYGQIDLSTAQGILQCGFGICLDLIEPSIMPYYVWSWAQGTCDISCVSNQCPSAGVNGWVYQDCANNLYFACQNQTDPNNWQLSSSQGTFSDAGCPQGFQFNFPRNPTENRNVLQLLASNSVNSVWINAPYSFQPNSTICTQPQSSSPSTTPLDFLLFSLVIFISLFIMI